MHLMLQVIRNKTSGLAVSTPNKTLRKRCTSYLNLESMQVFSTFQFLLWWFTMKRKPRAITTYKHLPVWYVMADMIRRAGAWWPPWFWSTMECQDTLTSHLCVWLQRCTMVRATQAHNNHLCITGHPWNKDTHEIQAPMKYKNSWNTGVPSYHKQVSNTSNHEIQAPMKYKPQWIQAPMKYRDQWNTRTHEI